MKIWLFTMNLIGLFWCVFQSSVSCVSAYYLTIFLFCSVLCTICVHYYMLLFKISDCTVEEASTAQMYYISLSKPVTSSKWSGLASLGFLWHSTVTNLYFSFIPLFFITFTPNWSYVLTLIWPSISYYI